MREIFYPGNVVVIGVSDRPDVTRGLYYPFCLPGKDRTGLPAEPCPCQFAAGPYFRGEVERAQAAWRRFVAKVALHGIPVPAMSSALAFYAGYRHQGFQPT